MRGPGAPCSSLARVWDTIFCRGHDFAETLSCKNDRPICAFRDNGSRLSMSSWIFTFSLCLVRADNALSNNESFAAGDLDCQNNEPWMLASSHRYSGLSGRKDIFSDLSPPCKQMAAKVCQRHMHDRTSHAMQRRLGLIYPPSIAHFCGARLLYLDLGANAPRSSVRKFYSTYPNSSLFRIVAFEPSPRWVAAFAREMPTVELWPYAVGLSNGTALFDGGGSEAAKILSPPAKSLANDKKTSEGPKKPEKRENPKARRDSVVVKTIDFLAWLQKHVQPADYVVCKMDVEGAEFELVPALIASGAAPLIDELFIECHSEEIGRNGPHHYHECVKMLRDAQNAGMWVHEWF